MQNFEDLRRELQRRGKSAELEALASSEDGAKLASLVDGDALARAAQAGDAAALRSMLGTVLRSDEGRRLVENVQKLMDR